MTPSLLQIESMAFLGRALNGSECTSPSEREKCELTNSERKQREEPELKKKSEMVTASLGGADRSRDGHRRSPVS